MEQDAPTDWHSDYRQHFNPSRLEDIRNFFGRQVEMGVREGVRFQNRIDGQWLYNCHSNGGTFNWGHRHPRLVEIFKAELDKIDCGNHWFASPLRAELARRLSRTTDGLLPGALLCTTGGEATDAAIKFSNWLTGRRGIISAEGGFHGLTGLATATGAQRWKAPFGCDLEGFVQVPYNDIAAMDEAITDQTSAVILESIPATIGMPQVDANYFEEVGRLCRKRGALLIMDEIQTGLGRTGTHWFYQQFNVEPDIVLVGKGLGGGIYPVSAALLSGPLMRKYAEDSFAQGSTYAGSELGCTIALGVLDLLEEENITSRVNTLSTKFREAFADLPFNQRGHGLFMGFDWRQEGKGIEAARRLYDEGIWAVFAASYTAVTQFLPPLITSDAEAQEIIDRVRRASTGGPQ
ncbi:MAG TPA: aminotransferase class III-fold pyridoxal phosphate-dependent enzyme [Pseudomonadales bacterium]|jgi:acetylornithine/succinyldiaminopimelate/putrescine aminotransferase|nr:aminotransferase class III-fold pyridoxal phosphate-dependent enzyme [Pseudomonadales bacterium]MDP6316416.1 aminotransferase class III-fold pyridoxal phosphate-dependent enzyme [Pseudomonadales bacterium]HJP51239.1 aminotransferase class III-fold pyridoxal phosphate-dependent enzyme [Pseudomonadales bacterium]|tara:strand:- start:4286 stop:5503 length:1218 start_codon:yes stop_codon:yes gene_type:complete